MNEDLELVFFQNIFDVTFGSVFFFKQIYHVFLKSKFLKRENSHGILLLHVH